MAGRHVARCHMGDKAVCGVAAQASVCRNCAVGAPHQSPPRPQQRQPHHHQQQSNPPAFSVLNLRERTVPGSMDRESARWPLLRQEENGSVWGLICKL